MTVGIDPKKFRNKFVLHSFLVIFFIGIGIAVLIMNLKKPEGLNSQSVLISSGLLLIAIISGIPFRQMMLIRKNKREVIIIENGVLTVKALLFKSNIEIPISDIQNTTFSERSNNIQRLEIHLKSSDNSDNVVKNQLKGKSIYLNDYYLDRSEFKAMADTIVKNVA